MGTQQLLLDVYNLKTLMLHVRTDTVFRHFRLRCPRSYVNMSSTPSHKKTQAPTIGLPSGEGGVPPSSYTKYVTKQFAKMEVRAFNK